MYLYRTQPNKELHMRFSRRFQPFKSTTKQNKAKGTIKSVTIEFQVRPHAIDQFSETLFAAREVVRLGLGKNAQAMRWGIRVADVPASRIDALRSHATSMGAKRWWISN
jgi:hypothetical protein